MQPITTTQQLTDACRRMAEHPFVTVDTEFLRESTYYPKLCVAQMANTTESVVIDSLADGLDLSPFFELMADEKVVKVFHAARQDIEICWHEAGIIPHPLVDTQVAAMVLGYGDFDLLRSAGPAHHRRQPRQVASLYRLDTATAERSAARLCSLRCDPSVQGLFNAVRRARKAEARRLDARGDEGAHLSRYLSLRARACLGAPEDAGAQGQGARGADRGGGLARAGGAGARRPARKSAQGRCHWRHCIADTDLD